MTPPAAPVTTIEPHSIEPPAPAPAALPSRPVLLAELACDVTFTIGRVHGLCRALRAGASDSLALIAEIEQAVRDLHAVVEQAVAPARSITPAEEE